MKLPRAVLFDHDGVLVTSEPIHLQAWQLILEEIGLPFIEADLRMRVGKIAPLILASLLDQYRPGWNDADYDLNALALRKNEHYLRLSETQMRPYPAVRELLAWLTSKQIPIAVVSNARRRELVHVLEKLDLIKFFQTVVARDDVRAAKPDPLPYLFAAGTLGIPPEECLAVEDSPTGLEAALLGKIPAAAVTTNFTATELQTPVPGRGDLSPIWIGASISELYATLQAI